MIELSGQEAFAAYEAVRHRLPNARTAQTGARKIANLDEIADQFDVFLLDAFGVLNIGESPIPETPERVAGLQSAGKRVLIVSNAASVPPTQLQAKYARLGYSFALEDIITSRMACIAGIRDAEDLHWGVMARRGEDMSDFPVTRWSLLEDDPATYDAAEGFILISTGDWDMARQSLLERSLQATPRPIRVANPDIVAPRETGFSTEPGFIAHGLADQTGEDPAFFGKPFASIYDLAFARLGDIDRSRIVMVGDSLHTDVLGAHAAGVASVLIAEFGFFAGQDVSNAISLSGIEPTYIAKRP
ncbi:MAG: HAD hydrolase-like protein [Pseudomonadota bacterium]